MSPPFRWFLTTTLILTVILAAAVLAGCASSGLYTMSDHWCAAHPEASPARCKEQSWDQENLKRNDHGCPTAIFIAPSGNLVQC